VIAALWPLLVAVLLGLITHRFVNGQFQRNNSLLNRWLAARRPPREATAEGLTFHASQGKVTQPPTLGLLPQVDELVDLWGDVAGSQAASFLAVMVPVGSMSLDVARWSTPARLAPALATTATLEAHRTRTVLPAFNVPEHAPPAAVQAALESVALSPDEQASWEHLIDALADEVTTAPPTNLVPLEITLLRLLDHQDGDPITAEVQLSTPEDERPGSGMSVVLPIRVPSQNPTLAPSDGTGSLTELFPGEGWTQDEWAKLLRSKTSKVTRVVDLTPPASDDDSARGRGRRLHAAVTMSRTVPAGLGPLAAQAPQPQQARWPQPRPRSEVAAAASPTSPPRLRTSRANRTVPAKSRGPFLAPVTKARIVTAGLPHVGLTWAGMGWLPASRVEVSANSVAVGATAEATHHGVLEVSRMEVDWSEWTEMTPHVRDAMRDLLCDLDNDDAVRKIQQKIRQRLDIAEGVRTTPVVERDIAPGANIELFESDAVALGHRAVAVSTERYKVKECQVSLARLLADDAELVRRYAAAVLDGDERVAFAERLTRAAGLTKEADLLEGVTDVERKRTLVESLWQTEQVTDGAAVAIAAPDEASVTVTESVETKRVSLANVNEFCADYDAEIEALAQAEQEAREAEIRAAEHDFTIWKPTRETGYEVYRDYEADHGPHYEDPGADMSM
jgi:hypothetical protein